MKQNMKKWMYNFLNSPDRKAMPIISFPGAELMNMDSKRFDICCQRANDLHFNGKSHFVVSGIPGYKIKICHYECWRRIGTDAEIVVGIEIGSYM